ncbi:MAG: DNA methyltransferase, partial [Alphaproteobacteria bacterium]
MTKASPKKKNVAVDSIKHKESRANIPTKELRGFVKEDEEHPKSLLYPRDPSLDPQLVWRGKDEQDQSDLEVPVVPIYIQEKIHPQAIIENLKEISKSGDAQQELNMFADFNGIGDDFSKRIDFYSHNVQPHWSNRMVLGDSLLVMTSLAEKEGLRGKVQCIYLDPPYGIKFGSNWQVSTRKNKVDDGKAAEVSREPEQVKAFRDTWALGIHSYLAYLRDRLVAARDLLTETGSVFVQISDENVHLVRNILDEVFGSENYICQTPFRKKSMPLGATYIETMDDILLWYGKDAKQTKYKQLYKRQNVEGLYYWGFAELKDGSKRKLTKEEMENHSTLPQDSLVARLVSLRPPTFSANSVFP